MVVVVLVVLLMVLLVVEEEVVVEVGVRVVLLIRGDLFKSF